MKFLIKILFLILFIHSSSGQTIDKFHARPIDSLIYQDTVKTPINPNQSKIYSSANSSNKRKEKKYNELKQSAELHVHKDTIGRMMDDEIYGIYLKRIYGFDFYLELNFNFDWTGHLKKVVISYLTDTNGKPLDLELKNKINFNEIIENTWFINISSLAFQFDNFNGSCIIYTGIRKKLNL